MKLQGLTPMVFLFTLRCRAKSRTRTRPPVLRPRFACRIEKHKKPKYFLPYTPPRNKFRWRQSRRTFSLRDKITQKQRLSLFIPEFKSAVHNKNILISHIIHPENLSSNDFWLKIFICKCKLVATGKNKGVLIHIPHLLIFSVLNSFF